MKQYITIDQLNELSEKGKERLREWWKPTGLEPILYKFSTTWGEAQNYPDGEFGFLVDPDSKDKKKALPLLSIGQMIEFLFDNDFGPQIYSNDTAFYFTVEPEKKLDCWKQERYEDSELCNALWLAVKDVLESISSHK